VVGRSEYAKGTWWCRCPFQHGGGIRAVKAEGVLGGVLGCCEEGLEHWSKATPGIDGEGDENHFVAYEVADDIVTFDEWGCGRCWFVGASEFSTLMSLKIGVCVGSDEGDVVFRGRLGRWGWCVCYVDIGANCCVMAEV
jgi:hypothetical protein